MYSKITPLISIIVPVYNSRKFLRRSLVSVARQSFSDFECICVDDGSTDWSGNVLDEFSTSDDRFVVIHKKNGGVSSARNVGLDNARGKYFVFFDSDDIMHPDMLKACYIQIEKHNADFVFFNEYRVNEDEIDHQNEEDVLTAESKVFSNPVFFCSKICGIGLSGVIQMMFRSSCWADLRFDARISHGEDTLAFYMFLRDARSGVWLKARPLLYIQRKGSLTHFGSGMSSERHRIMIMEKLIKYYASSPRKLKDLRHYFLSSLIQKPVKLYLRSNGVPKMFALIARIAFKRNLVRWMDFTPRWQFRLFMMFRFNWYISKER